MNRIGQIGRCPRTLSRVFLLASLCSWSAFAVSDVTFPLRWRWSNPLPHGNNIVDMTYSALPGLAVQVTERGQIYTTADLDLWLPRDSGVTNALRAVTFFGTRVVVTGESGVVLYADSVDDFRAGTLTDGPTIDWLEAAAASQSLVVAVGDNGAVYTSGDGINWKRQNSGVTDWLRGVAFGGGTFVAAGETGTIITSSNGTNWTRRTSGTGVDLNRVSFSTGTWTVVGDGGVTLVSSSAGVTWLPQIPYSGATNNLFFAAQGGADRLLVGENEVRVFDNGLWSDELAKTNGPPPWTYYAAIGRPDFFLIAGRTGLMAEGYQVNGDPYFWLPSSASIRNWLWDVVWIPNLYVAVGDLATVMTSGNGVDWSPEFVPDAMTNSIFLGVGGTTNLLVAVGNQGSLMISPNNTTNVVFTNQMGNVITQAVSTLGVIWQAVVPRPTVGDLQGVGYFNGLYIVTGTGGTVLTSPDGTNWTTRFAPTSKLLTSVASFPGGVVATGDDGAIVTSTNGTNWESQTSGTLDWLYRVRYLNGQLITVGQNGRILTSSNGTNWTSRTSGTGAWLNDVTFIAGTYFAVGTQGTLLSSTDSVNWTNRGVITAKSLYSAATDSRQLIVVGIEGVILRSPVVPDLTPISILSYAHAGDTNSGNVQNLYLFAGKTDQRFTLDYREGFDTNVWVTGPQLEFFDSSGTLYYLETIAATNAPSTEFYRGTLTP